MNKYFTTKDKLLYYVRFIVNKLRIFSDCRNAKIQVLIVELLWLIRDITKLDITSSFLIFTDYFETSRGKLYINRDLQSAITISPTYENDDIQKLISLMDSYVQKSEKILFIDVGAHIGIYSVALGTHFHNCNTIDYVAFEPDANNFSKNNSKLYLKNISANKIKNVTLYNVGLGSKSTMSQNQYGFITKKMDDILNSKIAKKYDVIFMKIDIEGFEEEALRGAKLFIKNSKNFYCLTEDCVNIKIFDYMERNFKFVAKISPYNSFWRK